MKKSELLKLTELIEHLVYKEVKKQSPKIMENILSDLISFSGSKEKKEKKENISQKELMENIEDRENGNEDEVSMKNLVFSANKNTTKMEGKKEKYYTKNPVLNKILNETVSDLKQKELYISPAAFHGSSNSYNVPLNINSEPNINKPIDNSSNKVLDENNISMQNLPENVSVLDVARQVPKSVSKALTRNYSSMLKLIDSKRKK